VPTRIRVRVCARECDVVCSIIDGRGDFVIGNVHQQSVADIFTGVRAQELRRLVLSTGDSYCLAIGNECPLESTPFEPREDPPVRIRFLAIEPTTACDLRCLSCPVRDFTGDVTWRDAYRDGGVSFLLWDGLRRSEQHAADGVPSRHSASRRQSARAAWTPRPEPALGWSGSTSCSAGTTGTSSSSVPLR
jgi:hypothetical protein